MDYGLWIITYRYIRIWLVVWNIFMLVFIYWEYSSQLTFIFFRGVETTNQYIYMLYIYRIHTWENYNDFTSMRRWLLFPSHWDQVPCDLILRSFLSPWFGIVLGKAQAYICTITVCMHLYACVWMIYVYIHRIYSILCSGVCCMCRARRRFNNPAQTCCVSITEVSTFRRVSFLVQSSTWDDKLQFLWENGPFLSHQKRMKLGSWFLVGGFCISLAISLWSHHRKGMMSQKKQEICICHRVLSRTLSQRRVPSQLGVFCRVHWEFELLDVWRI